MNKLTKNPSNDELDCPLAYVMRDGVIESIHRGRLVIVNDAGNVEYQIGDSNVATFMRSTAKPFQASLLVETGAYKEYNLSDKELAVIAGSHSGDIEHIEILKNLLRKLRLTEDNLMCGISNPLGWQIKRPQTYLDPLTPLHCDCSGKHIGMLILCLWGGYELTNYTDVSHPIQEMYKSKIGEVCSVNIADIRLGIDGCGVPTFALPLRQIALAFSKFGSAYNLESPEALYFVAKAMRDNPTLVAGRGRLATELMKATQGRVIVKCGAEGVYGLSFPDHRLGMAIKISDGNPRAAAPVIISFLKKISLLTHREEEKFFEGFHSVILNNHGTKVGEIISLL